MMKTKILKRTLLLVAMLLACAVQSRATDFTYNGLTYTILTDSTCETKAGSHSDADEWFAGNSVSGDLIIPETVYYNGNAYSVTKIGGYAFCGCTGLTEVIIPNSVTEISLGAFDGCSGLTEVTFPNSVTTIGDYAFSSCTGLTKVAIGSAVTSIGKSAFASCAGLKWIESQAVTPPTIQSDTFSDYSVPLLAASDDYKTDYYWKKFTTIAVQYTPMGTTFEVDGLKYEIISISDLTCRLYAIDETVTGENVVIPESVVYKNRTFRPIEIKGVLRKGLTSVKSVSIPSCTTTISPYLFLMTSLEKLTINVPISNILAYGSNIDELVVTSSVPKISNGLSTNTIGKITIEDSETALTTTQFKCGDTKEVYLGRNVSASTFRDMTALEKVTISDKVTFIDDNVFYGCSGLSEVVIPNSVTSIGSGAFYGCTAIKSVVSHNTTPPTIGNADSTFSGDTYLDGVLYVPDASIEAYQAAAGWKNFWEIKPLSEYSGVNEIIVDNCVGAISVDNGAISVSGDVPVRIVALNGTTVYSGRGDARVNVAPGIYVVIVGNKAHKVAVR
jgi:hypothetical protein